MAKERLSKLQKWILSHCLENGLIWQNEAREFYGKHFSPGTKMKGEYAGVMEGAYTKVELEKFYNKEGRMGRWWNFDKRGYDDEPTERFFYIPKKECISTKAERISIWRSFKNLADKDFITREKEWKPWQLSEKGFLIVNQAGQKSHLINFKDYQSKIKELQETSMARISELEGSIQKMIGGDQHSNKFTPTAVFNLCCESCQKKIMEFSKECGEKI